MDGLIQVQLAGGAWGRSFMPRAGRILIVADMSHKPVKMTLNQAYKLGKGFIRLGHDVRYFDYYNVLMGLSPLKSKTFAGVFCKAKADAILAGVVGNYGPDIVCLNIVRMLNAETIDRMRQAAPSAVFIGLDGDPWPELQRDRVETAKKLDIVAATNDGKFLQTYRDAGVPKCVFMPNLCDPDIDHRYDVSDEWKTDILWTGQIRHNPKRFPGETMRYELVSRLAGLPNANVYGCCGRESIGGMNYLYAISGARIALSINGDNNVRLYHSDRLTHYLAGGAFVLAKRVPDTDLLFRDGEHLIYFDTVDEFFELAKWYLGHESERKKIADAGMRWTHEQFNCVKMAGYMLDLVEKGDYDAPWFSKQ